VKTPVSLASAAVALSTVAALFTASGGASAATAHQPDPLLQRDVDATAAAGAAGVLLRVTRNGVVTQYRAGTAVLGTDHPVPFGARFRVGSITKVFTGTVLLQLAAEGRVGLDTPVARYLPGLLPGGDAITVRMILEHTSGIYDYVNSVPSDGAPLVAARFRHYDARQLVESAAARPLLFPPGTKFSYSDTNYLVAGLLITAVTGRSWNSEVTDRIIRPLHLSGTFAPGDYPLIPGPHADGYLLVGDMPVNITAWNPSVAGPAGAVISTTADLNRFLTALLGGRLLPPAELAQMETANPFTRAYGLGLQVIPLPCGITVYGHEGGVPGYSSFALSTLNGSRQAEAVITLPERPPVALSETLLEDAFCR
jgi:D-alanyl-D-alanine carboxypeptidase